MTHATEAAPPVKKGVIHDIGDARYAGERRAPSTLWRVIMRHQIAHAWKTWWRWKPAIIGAVITTVVCGVIMYVSADSRISGLTRAGGPLAFIDGTLAYSFGFYNKFAFLMTMTVGAAVVARDQETGAFAFYFSRPVRARDYVVGKVAGMVVVMGSILLAGPLLLAAFRIGMAGDTKTMIDLLPWLGRALTVGLLASLTYATLPLALSALVGKRTIALAVWAAYYVMGTSLLSVVGMLTWRPLAAIDPANAVVSLAFGMWDITMPGQDKNALVGVAPAAISLATQTLLAVGLLYNRVSRQAAGAVGASS